ncbi:MAG: Crp/Fnr family transcriptional regulator [Oceanicaulis sp.]
MNKFISRLSKYADLKTDDVQALRALPVRMRNYSARQTLVQPGAPFDKVWWVEHGWATRKRRLPDGTVQIVNFLLPGEFFDLQGLVGGRCDHAVLALTDLAVFEAPAADVRTLVSDRPRLRDALIWSGVAEAAILREHVVQIGRQPALRRVAFLIASLRRRQALSAEDESDTLEQALGHDVIADALGLSRVHVSRTLKQLRDTGLIEIAAGRIRVIDADGLDRAAQHDTAYLHVAGPATSA